MAEHPDGDFPSTPIERSAIAARTGLKVGANYARYLARRAVSSETRDESRKALHDQNARDIFKQLSRLRGTALKLAQGVSLDPGIIPDEFIEVMSQAQYSVPAMTPALVERRIRQSLGAPSSQVFAEFNPVALAAASIGQVHEARLPDGRKVAVKIQYPNVRNTIEADLKMARGLASRVVKGSVDPFLDEVRGMMLAETDYAQEGRNIEFFAEQYTDEGIVTPRWIPEFSSDSVLTMTFLEGRHIQAFLDTHPSQERCNHFGQLLFDFSHRQVASGTRTIHADFHPGNFLFRADGRLGIVDFGCVKTLPQDFMDDFLLVFRAHLHRDKERLHTLYTRLRILSPDLSPDLHERLSAFFLKMGEMIVLPYRKVTFDFGDPSFGEDIRAIGREAMRFRERQVIGSPHFIFVNRVMFGLLSMLTQLKTVVRTDFALSTINHAIDRIGERAA